MAQVDVDPRTPPPDCPMCGLPFGPERVATREHIVPRCFFVKTPPNTWTMWACKPCNNGLSVREERLRNAFVAGSDVAPREFPEALEKAQRSKSYKPEAGYTELPSGVIVPIQVIDVSPDDVLAVFRKITIGLSHRALQPLPASIPIGAHLLTAEEQGREQAFFFEKAGSASKKFPDAEEFSFATLNFDAATHETVWLFRLFGCRVVWVGTGPMHDARVGTAKGVIVGNAYADKFSRA